MVGFQVALAEEWTRLFLSVAGSFPDQLSHRELEYTAQALEDCWGSITLGHPRVERDWRSPSWLPFLLPHLPSIFWGILLVTQKPCFWSIPTLLCFDYWSSFSIYPCSWPCHLCAIPSYLQHCGQSDALKDNNTVHLAGTLPSLLRLSGERWCSPCIIWLNALSYYEEATSSYCLSLVQDISFISTGFLSLHHLFDFLISPSRYPLHGQGVSLVLLLQGSPWWPWGSLPPSPFCSLRGNVLVEEICSPSLSSNVLQALLLCWMLSLPTYRLIFTWIMLLLCVSTCRVPGRQEVMFCSLTCPSLRRVRASRIGEGAPHVKWPSEEMVTMKPTEKTSGRPQRHRDSCVGQFIWNWDVRGLTSNEDVNKKCASRVWGAQVKWWYVGRLFLNFNLWNILAPLRTHRKHKERERKRGRKEAIKSEREKES